MGFHSGGASKAETGAKKGVVRRESEEVAAVREEAVKVELLAVKAIEEAMQMQLMANAGLAAFDAAMLEAKDTTDKAAEAHTAAHNAAKACEEALAKAEEAQQQAARAQAAHTEAVENVDKIAVAAEEAKAALSAADIELRQINAEMEATTKRESALLGMRGSTQL